MDRSSAAVERARVPGSRVRPRPLLTVVVPVYNGGHELVDNVRVIQSRIAEGLEGAEVEVIVVSDGSIDGTGERLLESRGETGIRVIHYDRNLGKGYAVRAGALASRGEWVALVDSDLDLDPGSIPEYLEVARRERLDFVIGSKRHPDSVVSYPAARRAASWSYQQLNRLLFKLDVRDTQVGLKVFSRRVVDDIMPLLLVKRFAFDLELLAVAAALGYRRVRELPVRLEYRFTGSALGSRAVVSALVDTAAIFYRLRILGTYQRKRHLLRGSAAGPEQQPWVTLVGDTGIAAALDYSRLDVMSGVELTEAALSTEEELLAVLAPGVRPAGNWLAATVPFFADPDVAAVVVPTVASLRSSLRERAAAAVLESRLGGGSRRSRYFPGNVRMTADDPAESLVVRTADLRSALDAAVDRPELVSWLAARGRKTVYTPDASLSAPAPPLVRPHLSTSYAHARTRGTVARRTRGASLSSATALSLAPLACAAFGAALLAWGSGDTRRAGTALVVAYGATVAVSATLAAIRFRSLRVGLLAAPAVVATQGTYLAGFLHGFARGR